MTGMERLRAEVVALLDEERAAGQRAAAGHHMHMWGEWCGKHAAYTAVLALIDEAQR